LQEAGDAEASNGKMNSRLIVAASRFFNQGDADPAEQNVRLGTHWPVLILSVIASALLSLAIGQDISWDVLNYHFYDGFAILHKPLNFDFAPAQVQSFFNPLAHILSYALLAHLPSRLVAALLGGIQGLNLYLIFRISQALFRNWSSPLRFLLSLGNAIAACGGVAFIMELGTTFGDNLSSILVLTALLLIIRFLQLESIEGVARRSYLYLAGAILGAAFGLKLTVGIYVCALAILLPVLLIRSEGCFRSLFMFFALLGVGFLATYGFWGYSLYREYQNPFFIFFNGFFKSPYYDLENIRDPRFLPQTWQQAAFYAFYFMRKNTLVSEIVFRDARLALCYVAALILAAAGLFRFIHGSNKFNDRNRAFPQSRQLVFLVLFMAIAYALWEYQFSIYRYVIVLELLAPVLLSLTLAYFFKRKAAVLVLSLTVNAAVCLSTVYANFGRQHFDDGFLKVDVPKIAGLEQGVVLMGGGEGTSYIIPHFPSSTRFIRVSSNFLYPKRNVNLDNKIRQMLAGYDDKHTFVYFANGEEREQVERDVGYHGIYPDYQECFPVPAQANKDGFLCRARNDSQSGATETASNTSQGPVFEDVPGVQMVVSLRKTAGKSQITFRLTGSDLGMIDVLYTLDGKEQPPATRWNLDRQHSITFPVTGTTTKGSYRIIGIRDSDARDKDPWIRVDAAFLVP
jgi:hypothetical protein